MIISQLQCPVVLTAALDTMSNTSLSLVPQLTHNLFTISSHTLDSKAVDMLPYICTHLTTISSEYLIGGITKQVLWQSNNALTLVA